MTNSYSKIAVVGVGTLVALVVLFSVWNTNVSTAETATATPSADSQQCTQILTNVEQHLSQDCNNMDRDHVCYGNDTIKVELQNASNTVIFAKPGDVAPLNNVKSLTAGPLNPETGNWGVAVLKVQTDNLAETTAGQAATFILYGDTTLNNNGTNVSSAVATPPATAAVCQGTVSRQTLLRKKPDLSQPSVETLKANDAVNATARTKDGTWTFVESNGKSGWMPTSNVKLQCDPKSLSVDDPSQIASLPGLNAFYFSTNIGAQSSCKDIPPSGMLIQSPTGHKISFQINGVKVTMGSSLLFVTKPNGDMEVLVVEGQGTLQVGGRTLVLNPSQAAVVNALSFKLQRGDLVSLAQDFGLALGTDDKGNPIVLMDSLAGLFKSLGLDLPTDILARPVLFLPTPVPTVATSCGSRTFNSNGTVCIPGVGVVPCNRNGVCDNGEHYYICPEDCGAPIPPNQHPNGPPMIP